MEDIIKSFEQAWRLLASFDSEVYSIILLSLIVSVSSSAISAILAIPAGISLGSREFACKKVIMRIIHTLMGLPPVVAGLLVYVFISRKGPLGSLQLLFTPMAMVIAQVIIVFPIVTGLTAAAVKLKSSDIIETCRGIGLGKLKTLQLLLRECRYPIYTAVLTGYGRAISEVGAVMLVGGNIRYNTRVMTTAIVLETGKGNYDVAIAIGLILLAISFIINSAMHRFQES